MLKNVKIGTKLIGAFLIVAALCAFVGVFGALKMRSTTSVYLGGWEQNNENLESVAGLRTAFVERRLYAYRSVLMDSADKRDGLLRELEDSRQHMREALARYEKTISTDDAHFVETDRQLFGQVKSIDREYEDVLQGVITAIRANRHEQAINSLAATAVKGTQMKEAVDQLSALKVKAGKQLSADLASSASSAVVTDIVVVVVTVLVSLA